MGEDEKRRLLETCRGDDFADRRDAAILRLFMSTGIRRAEMAGLHVSDLDLDAVPLVGPCWARAGECGASASGSHKAVEALDRYLTKRGTRPDADSEWLWLGQRGRLGETGVEQMVKRRGEAVGLSIHPHVLRRTFAHDWLTHG